MVENWKGRKWDDILIIYLFIRGLHNNAVSSSETEENQEELHLV
jgi:hypothetical protein